MHIPALRSADHRDAPLSSTEDGDQLACPLPTLAGSHTSDGWRESDVSYFGHYLIMQKLRSCSTRTRPDPATPGGRAGRYGARPARISRCSHISARTRSTHEAPSRRV